MRRTSRAVAVAAVVLLAAGCGGHGSTAKDTDKDKGGEFERAADRNTCLADAKQVSHLPAAFPQRFPFPQKTVVYSAQDRGTEGVIATGVTSLPFQQVLASLNGPAQEAGYKVTDGETEAHDAEANWAGNGYRGRWAIRESASCPGETVVQVLALPTQ
jgi:hypothetical protein